jgi:hypothetical protein
MLDMFSILLDGFLKKMGIPGSTKLWIEPTTHGDMVEMT